MNNGFSGLGVFAKCAMDVFGDSNVLSGKGVEAIEVLGAIADETIDGCEFFDGGFIPVGTEFVREAPLLSGVGDHESLAVRVGEGNPEFYKVLAVIGFYVCPVPAGGSCGEGFVEFCGEVVCFDGAGDIVGAGGGVLIDFADDVGEVFGDVGMCLIRQAGVYAEGY